MSKPRIFFDATQLVHWQGKYTGIPRVMHELARRFSNKQAAEVVFVSWVKEIPAFCEVDLDTSLNSSEVLYAQSGKASVATAVNSRLVRRAAKKVLGFANKARPGLSDRVQVRTAKARLKDVNKADIKSGDVLFVPWGEWWDPAFTDHLEQLCEKGVKLVQIIHDMATTVQPQFFERIAANPRDYNSRVLPKSALVLTVSKNTNSELTSWLKSQNLKLPKIKVFREGDDFEVAYAQKPSDPKFIERGLKGQDYILSVGTIEAKKNHLLLYYVYKRALEKGLQLPKLVVVGRKGWGHELPIELMTLDPDVKDQFVLLHDTSDEELSWLYDNCLFSILASFHEGWGIPIAESISRGVPCLSSNTSSMVEVAKGYTQHFSPLSTDECLLAIANLLKPDKLKAAREHLKGYKQFSWDESYKQVAKLVEEVL